MKRTAIIFVWILMGCILSTAYVCRAEIIVEAAYTQDSAPNPDGYMRLDVERTILTLNQYYDDVWGAYLEGDLQFCWYLDGNVIEGEREEAILVQPSFVGGYLQASMTCGEHTVFAVAILITETPQPPQITTSLLPDATVGKPYQTVISASDPGVVFTLSEETVLLPIGLTLGTDGVLSGTPETAGVYSFTVVVTGQGGVDSCTFTLTVNEAPHIHIYGDWETVTASDCRTQGKQQKSCACGHVVTELLPLGEHDWDQGTLMKEPTEEEKGERTHTCLVCGQTAKTEVDKLPHTHVFRDWVIGQLPNGDEPGYRVRTCACGESETEYFVETEHIWDDGVVTKEPSETEEGEMTYTCQYCRQTRIEVMEKLPHLHVYGDWVVEQEPSCTLAGLRVRYCVCSHSEREEIEKNDHRWDEGTVKTEPSEAAQGERVFACLNCTQTKSEPIDRLPHTHVYGDWQVTEAPTCTKKGVETKICRCTDAIIRDLPMLDHTWDKGRVTKEAKCEMEGECTRTCVCGETVTETIPALAHAWDKGKVTKQPTEKGEGERTFACRHCGQTKSERIAKTPQKENIVPPAGEVPSKESSSVVTARMILLVTFLATAAISIVTGVVLKKIK